MPHPRLRLATSLLEKRLKLFPVVAIQGARQTGKSFLAREIFQKKHKQSHYLSFDSLSLALQAQSQPETFLAEHEESRPLIIDEAQKAPAVFDAIKLSVDKKRNPGRFVLLGSTEFSKLTQVRESLTGRMGRIRVFPFNLEESLEHHAKGPVSRAQILHYLRSGGLPAIFSVRDETARAPLFEDWVSLACTRDILQFKTLKLDPELCHRILPKTAQLEEPTRAAIARSLRVDSRKIQTHLNALAELFILQPLAPHPAGTGQTIYLPFDVGLAGFLGADRQRRLQILLMNERLCKNWYSGKTRKTFYYYRSSGKNHIHWIEESMDGSIEAFQVFDSERIKKTDAELMRTFLARIPKSKGRVFAPVSERMRVRDVQYVPWEEIGV